VLRPEGRVRPLSGPQRQICSNFRQSRSGSHSGAQGIPRAEPLTGVLLRKMRARRVHLCVLEGCGPSWETCFTVGITPPRAPQEGKDQAPTKRAKMLVLKWYPSCFACRPRTANKRCPSRSSPPTPLPSPYSPDCCEALRQGDHIVRHLDQASKHRALLSVPRWQQSGRKSVGGCNWITAPHRCSSSRCVARSAR